MKYQSLFENQRINILFIIIVNMLVYLNALFAGVSSLDDSGLFQALHNGDIILSQQLFSGGGHYFRPLTTLSYLFDYTVWNSNPAAFHFTNLLIHTANTLLVYALALTFFISDSSARPVALIAALLFAIHPANSESVVWISGRTDLLCALFFLLTLLIIMRTNRNNVTASCVLLFLAFICSLLSKESSIALMAIAPVWLLSNRREPWDMRSTTLCVTLVVAVNSYVILRSGISGHIDAGISTVTSTVMRHDMLKTGYDTLAVMGFYIKKMIWPYPLTIAIDSIDKPFYFLVGCGVLAASITMFFKQKQTRLPLAIILFGLLPPLLVYHAAIPWMPIAERYLYIPLVGAVLLLAVMIRNCGAHCRSLCFMVILVAAVTTTFRVAQWADPVALWGDTVAKAPSAPAVRVIYAHELQEIGRFADAAKQLDLVSSVKYEDLLYWRVKARHAIMNNNLHGYESSMINAARLTSNPSRIYNEIAGTLSGKSNHKAQHDLFLSKAIGYYEKAWELDHRATAGLYSAAKLSLRMGDKEGCRRLLNLYLAIPEKKLHTDKAEALLNELTSREQSDNDGHAG